MGEKTGIKSRLSWWEYDHFFSDSNYTIIGSGIAGLSTAIELKTICPKEKVLVLDKKKLPIGASTKNAGFACFGSISEILDDYNSFGEATCLNLIKMRWEGLKILKSRVSEAKMRYSDKSGAEIFKNEEEVNYFENKIQWANSLVASIVGDKNCFGAEKGRFGSQIINRFEGALNPQMMINELELIARNLGVLFINGIEVNEIDLRNKRLETAAGLLNYQKLIVCTNGFSRSLLPGIDIKPARNQVFITNKLPDFKLESCYHMNKGYVYFREYDGRLLIGGGRDIDFKTETTVELETTEKIISHLKKMVQEFILPNQAFEIAHSWSGILGVGQSKLPIVKMIDTDVLVAIRMGGMGVAVGSYIGRVAASIVCSVDNTAHRQYVS